MDPEKTLTTETIFKGGLVNLRVDTVELPDGKITQREIVEHAEVVHIVPVDVNDNVLLVSQYRKATGKESLEVPAGGINPGETPLNAAQRELREETGYMAESLQKISSFYSSPGFCTEFNHIFLATDLTHNPLEAEADENIQLSPMKVAELASIIREGKIADGKSVAGLLLYLMFYRGNSAY